LRKLGKAAATRDPRFAALRSVLPQKSLPVPASTNWRADMPPSVDMLGNDHAGCCVWATFLHYVQLAKLYSGQGLVVPTEEECLGPDGYGSTGYPAVDQGTVVAGPGGALEHWARTGVVCAGERNILSSVVTIDHRNLDAVARALSIGPVLAGALLREADMQSDWLWLPGDSPVVGGHFFQIIGHTTLSTGKRYFDVESWDSEFRFSDDWALQALDEAYMVLNPAFFGPSGLDPAGLNMAAVEAAMESLRA